MNKDIVLLDLFSGIGGFAVGLKQAGFNVTRHYFSEVNKHSIAVYRNNFKIAEYAGPVQNVRGRELERPNIITFGSPCQDFSNNGSKRGLEGKKSSLIWEAIRIITESQPDLFIWENVKGMFSTNAGADFWAVLQAFTNIGNYRLEWQLLNSKWVLPQNRERVYLIGHHRRCGSGTMVFPIERTAFSHRPKLIMETDIEPIKIRSNTRSGFEVANVGDSVNLGQLTSKTRRGRVGKGVSQTLDTTCKQAVVLQDGSLRRLTEIECERLQGFSDNWTKFGDYSDTSFKISVKEISRNQRFIMLGNAVTVDIVKQIGKRLLNPNYL